MNEPIDRIELLDEIRAVMIANNLHPNRVGSLKDYLDGANDSLNELACKFDLVTGFKELPTRP